MICDQESTRFKETLWLCFKVSFEFVPRELAAHKRASEEIHSLLLGEKDLPDDSVVFVHNSKSEIEDICLELFDSEPKILEQYPFTNLEEVANKGQVIIFCYGEEAKNEISYLIQSERNTVSEKVFFLILETKFIDWEFRKNAILKSLGNVIDGRNILHSQTNKVHLYETFCCHLDDQIRQLQKRFETSGSEHDLKLAKGVRHIYEKVLKPNANISSALETECKHLIERSDFLTAYMIRKNIVWVIGDTLQKKNEKPWPASFEERIRNENMEIKFGEIRPQGLCVGSKLFRQEDMRIFGSIGMFGTYKHEKDTQVCVSSAHILRKEDTGYIEHEGKIRELGNCIWPMSSVVSVLDEMSVIALDDSLQFSAEKHLHESVKLFEGSPSELLNRKVFKFGASSAMTKGFVDQVIVTSLGPETAYGITPHPKNSVFSTEGDSGSVVCTKMNRTIYAIGLVIGKFEPHDEQTSENIDTLIMVSNLQMAVLRFKKEMGGEIGDWRL
ncbi:uncharacterized protein LOC133189364 [Saccostrea echinata]|uniref:uncharacterized protein LOC133189364 n=1 Tax=Saccostrea echinata TaxID=191078 RepID=UPI002A819EB5|nr:uncharacterized protein LOC133189364 [Saccostrea echinata]